MQFQKISILLPKKGLEFPWGVGGSIRPKNLKKFMKLNWNIQRDEGSSEKSLPWGRYGYFLKLHNVYSPKTFETLIHEHVIHIVFFVVCKIFLLVLSKCFIRSKTMCQNMQGLSQL